MLVFKEKTFSFGAKTNPPPFVTTFFKQDISQNQICQESSNIKGIADNKLT